MQTNTPAAKRVLRTGKIAQSTPSTGTMRLDSSWVMMMLVQPGAMPPVEFLVDVTAKTTLRAELRISNKQENHTPDVILASLGIELKPGRRIKLPLNFNSQIGVARHAFVCLLANANVAIHLSDEHLKSRA